MTGIALVSVINHDHINALHLFWVTLYVVYEKCICVCEYVGEKVYLYVNIEVVKIKIYEIYEN